MNEKPKWKHPFGQSWQEKNRVEQYLREIFYAVDENHAEGLKELFEELSIEQHMFINNLLASYTRAKIKELLNESN